MNGVAISYHKSPLDVTISGEAMATTDRSLSTSAAALHLRPLDSVILMLEASSCAWCQALLRLLKSHLEEDISPFAEVLN